MATTRGITVRWSTSRCIINREDGIRTRIEAADACEMTEKIFAYRMLPRNPKTGEQVGAFSHVCSPADLEEFPADEPISGQQPAWFRLPFVDVFLRSWTETENFIEAVREDVRSLKHTLDVMDTITPAGEEVVGESCPAESSSSSQSSESLSSGSASSVSSAILSLTRVGTFEQTTGGGIDWTNVGEGAGTDVGSSDSMGANFSRVELPGGLFSKLLLTQGYDFCLLPDDAEIVGIFARLVLRRTTPGSSASSASLGDNPCPILTIFALYHPEHGLAENKADNECVDGPDWYDFVVGDDTDLWGNVWTAEDIKRGEFGAAIMITAPADLEDSVVDVDGVEITVYYRT